MLKITQEITSGSDLRETFANYGRLDQFSYEGYDKLFEMMNAWGSEVEIDVIAICCDFSEHSLDSVLKNYNLESFEELCDNTLAVMVDDKTVIYQGY